MNTYCITASSDYTTSVLTLYPDKISGTTIYSQNVALCQLHIVCNTLQITYWFMDSSHARLYSTNESRGDVSFAL